LERAYDKGPVREFAIKMLDSLRPHLARAALWSARLDLERAGAMAQMLEALELPGAALRGNGKLYASNPLFESLMPWLLHDRRDRLHLVDQEADCLLAEAFLRISILDGVGAVNSIPVAASESRPPYVLHLLPVRGAAHDLFSQATSLLVITPVDRSAVPTAEVLQGLFDLTPAEARLAGLVGQAKSPREAATILGVTEETARTTLKRVLAKTGVRRQAELVSLLGGAAIGPRIDS
jgi:DNA-binding CsgD family transcriptional regulator